MMDARGGDAPARETKTGAATTGHGGRRRAALAGLGGWRLLVAVIGWTPAIWAAAAAQTPERPARIFEGRAEAGVASAFFSPDGGRAAVCSRRGGEPAAESPLPGDDGATAARAAATSSVSGFSYVLWDSGTGREIKRGEGCPTWFAGDSRHVAVLNAGRAFLFDAATDQEEPGWGGRAPQGAHAGLFSPDDVHLIVTDTDGSVRLWDAALGRELWFFRRGAPSGAVEMSPDGRLIVSTESASAMALSASMGREVWSARGPWKPLARSFSPDGGTLLLLRQDGALELRAAAGGEAVRTIGDGTWSTAAWSPDGRHIATGGGDGAIALWDAASGARIATFPRQTDEIAAVAFTPDGRRLIAHALSRAPAAPMQTVKIWEISTGREILSAAVRAALLSRDGRSLVTVGGDGALTVWDAEEGGRLGLLAEPAAGGIKAAAVSGDGRYVLGVNGEGEARLWDVSRFASR